MVEKQIQHRQKELSRSGQVTRVRGEGSGKEPMGGEEMHSSWGLAPRPFPIPEPWAVLVPAKRSLPRALCWLSEFQETMPFRST